MKSAMYKQSAKKVCGEIIVDYLADRAGKDAQCWPAIPTIAKDLKLTQSTIRRALEDLRKAGLIETKQ